MFFTGGCGGGAGTAAATTTTTGGTAAVKKFHPHRIDLCADRNYFWGEGRVISNTCLWLVLFGKSQVLCVYCGTLV